jgi:sugar phosphate permease
MNPNSTLRAWLIWTLATLFVVFNYLHQVVPNIIADDLSRAFNVSASALRNIAASYFYAYAVLQIPVGFIVDRFGTRWPLIITIFAAALGTLAFSAAHAAGNAQLTRVIMGASSAFSFIGCLKLVQEWFPPSRFSTLAGMTNTAAMVGAASGAPVALLVKSVGWRAAIAWMGSAELALAVLALLMVCDGPATSKDLAPQPEPQHGNITHVLINPQVWINAIYATSISLVFVAFGGLWGANYIEKAYGVSALAAAGTGAFLFLGGIAGSLFYGWYSDFVGKRKSPMVQAGIGALITMSCMLYLPGLPLIGFKAGLFLVGFFSSANIVSYAVARDLYPKLAGLSIGFLSTVYYVGSATSQPLVGMLLERRNSGGPGAGLAALTAGDFRFAFLPLVFFMVVGLLAAILVKETLADKHPPGAVQTVPVNRAALS